VADLVEHDPTAVEHDPTCCIPSRGYITTAILTAITCTHAHMHAHIHLRSHCARALTGSSLCERFEANKTALEVYGFVDSIRVEWGTMEKPDGPPEEALVLSMDGRAECGVNPTAQVCVWVLHHTPHSTAPYTPLNCTIHRTQLNRLQRGNNK
jgi:hypothetical protein